MTTDPLRGACTCATTVELMTAALLELDLEPSCTVHEVEAMAQWKAKQEQADAVDHLARVQRVYDDMRPKEPGPERPPDGRAVLANAIAEWPTVDTTTNNVPIGSGALNQQFAAKFPGAETDFSEGA